MRLTALYHWSPTGRRKQIIRRGLVPHSRPVQGTWRAPYVCFHDTPARAWALSGARGHSVPSWDLWMMWSNRAPTLKALPGWEPGVPHEYRVYGRVYKRDLWYVATRA